MRAFELIDDAVRTVGRRVTGIVLREVVWIVVIAVLAATGVIFGVIAAYLALLTVWPSWAAALACAGGALALALLAFALRCAGLASRPGAVRPVGNVIDALGEDFSDLRESAKNAALEQYRNDPVGTLAGAVAVGAIIGLLKPRPRD